MCHSAFVYSSKSRGYVAITYHRVVAGNDAKLDSGLLVLRHIIKGTTGHTAVRLCDEMEGAFIDLAKLYIMAKRNDGAFTTADGDIEEASRRLAASALRRVLAITTDGGANMCKGAAMLMERYQPVRRSPLLRARICVQHTAQLILKHTCKDAELATALGACNYIAYSSKFSEYAFEALGHVERAVSTRWSSQITGAIAVCKKKQRIIDFCATPQATDAFRARVAALRAAGGDGFQLLEDFYSLLSPLVLLTDEFGADKRCTANTIIPKILEAKKKIDVMYVAAQQTGNHRIVRWYEELVKPLYDYYLDADFVEDELFQIAALLDPNGGGKKLMHAGGKATFDLAVQTTVEYIIAAVDDNAPVHDVAIAPDMPPEIAAAARQQSAVVVGVTREASVKSELLALVASTWSVSGVNEMAYYVTGDGRKYPRVAKAALSVLPVPAGEAAVERVFSLAGFFNASRRRFAPTTLVKVVSVARDSKKNEE